MKKFTRSLCGRFLGAVCTVKGRIISGVGAGAAAAGTATAQAPTMDPIALPFDLASAVTAVTTIGATILLAVWGPKIAFRLGHKLMKRIQGAM